MEKINLKEVLDFYMQDSIDKEGNKLYSSETVQQAMKEACRQTLELAAENAEWDDLGDGDLHGANIVVVKQSILDVINLIE
jgi:putative sterol carrier protein